MHFLPDRRLLVSPARLPLRALPRFVTTWSRTVNISTIAFQADECLLEAKRAVKEPVA